MRGRIDVLEGVCLDTAKELVGCWYNFVMLMMLRESVDGCAKFTSKVENFTFVRAFFEFSELEQIKNCGKV